MVSVITGCSYLADVQAKCHDWQVNTPWGRAAVWKSVPGQICSDSGCMVPISQKNQAHFSRNSWRIVGYCHCAKTEIRGTDLLFCKGMLIFINNLLNSKFKITQNTVQVWSIARILKRSHDIKASFDQLETLRSFMRWRFHKYDFRFWSGTTMFIN